MNARGRTTEDIRYKSAVFDLRYQKLFSAAQPMKQRFNFYNDVTAGVVRYALTTRKNYLARLDKDIPTQIKNKCNQKD